MVGQGDTRNYQIGNITKSLHDLSKELDCHISIGCQLSRLPKESRVRPPRLDDLRDSGEIEQDADLVIGLHRPEYYGIESDDSGSLKGIAEFHILKQRNGPTDMIKATWIPEWASFENFEYAVRGNVYHERF